MIVLVLLSYAHLCFVAAESCLGEKSILVVEAGLVGLCAGHRRRGDVMMELAGRRANS